MKRKGPKWRYLWIPPQSIGVMQADPSPGPGTHIPISHTIDLRGTKHRTHYALYMVYRERERESGLFLNSSTGFCLFILTGHRPYTQRRSRTERTWDKKERLNQNNFTTVDMQVPINYREISMLHVFLSSKSWQSMSSRQKWPVVQQGNRMSFPYTYLIYTTLFWKGISPPTHDIQHFLSSSASKPSGAPRGGGQPRGRHHQDRRHQRGGGPHRGISTLWQLTTQECLNYQNLFTLLWHPNLPSAQ